MSGDVDAVVGARSMEFPDMPMDRIMGNRVLDAVSNVGGKAREKDTQSGFRHIRGLPYWRFSSKGPEWQSNLRRFSMR